MAIILFGTREIETKHGIILLQVFFNERSEEFSYDFCIQPAPLGRSNETFKDAQSAFAAGEQAALQYKPEV